MSQQGLQVNGGYTLQYRGVNLNSASTDTPVHVPFAKYIVRRMTLTNVSTTLAASSATIGAYTAASAGGTAIVTPATATGLTAASKFNDRTIAVSADSLTGDTIYIRVGVANGAPATCDVYLELQSLE
jgi:hypothetical protein